MHWFVVGKSSLSTFKWKPSSMCIRNCICSNLVVVVVAVVVVVGGGTAQCNQNLEGGQRVITWTVRLSQTHRESLCWENQHMKMGSLLSSSSVAILCWCCTALYLLRFPKRTTFQLDLHAHKQEGFSPPHPTPPNPAVSTLYCSIAANNHGIL